MIIGITKTSNKPAFEGNFMFEVLFMGGNYITFYAKDKDEAKIHAIKYMEEKSILDKKKTNGNGKISNGTKKFVLDYWNNECFYCGYKSHMLTFDHVIPKSKGGSGKKTNIVPACKQCNTRKGSIDFKSYVKWQLRINGHKNLFAEKLKNNRKRLKELINAEKSMERDASITRNGGDCLD